MQNRVHLISSYQSLLHIADRIAAKHCSPAGQNITFCTCTTPQSYFIFICFYAGFSFSGKLQYMRVLNDLPPFGGFLFHTVGWVTKSEITS